MEEWSILIILGVVLVLGGAIVAFVFHNTRNAGPSVVRRLDPSTGQLAEFPLTSTGPPPLSRLLAEARELIPGFSLVLLEDSARALFARAHLARHEKAELDALFPPVVGLARDDLRQRKPKRTPVRSAFVGSVRLKGVSQRHRGVYVEFDACLDVGMPGEEATQWVRETWGWKWRPDERAGPWVVDHVSVDELRDAPPPLPWSAGTAATEPGTVFTPGREELRDTLFRDDPAFTFEALDARLCLVFEEIQKAWTTRDVSGARLFASAGLCQYLEYWFKACSQQGLRRTIEKATLVKSTLARVLRDDHFDSLTLRVWLRGRRWTERIDTGETMSGSWTEDGSWTEYWTLFRGAKVRGAPRADRRCPACSTEATIGPEGSCGSCGALVSAGGFDWVLGRIEQDDSYTG